MKKSQQTQQKPVKKSSRKLIKFLKIILLIVLLIITFIAGMFFEDYLYHKNKYPYSNLSPVEYFMASECEKDPLRCRVDKPLIYLYPTKPTKITISVDKPENLTTTYPKYNQNWQVLAQPNGKLTDRKNQQYYGLYWEGKNGKMTDFYDGFVVKKADLVPFLEQNLAILGLNRREANEFIIYWLPILEHNEYNLIRFQTLAEINQNMKLNITPKPDTLIRILIQFKPVKKDFEIEKQILKPIVRKGFTVVEWGGINNQKIK